MASKLFSILSRLSSNLQSNPKISQSLLQSRCYYTGKKDRITLYSKISPLGSPGTSLVPVLDQWLEQRKKASRKVSVSELLRIIRDLRRRRRYTQALEVSEWLNQKDFYKFQSGDKAVQLDLIGRVRGVDSAESHFDNMSDQDKNDKTYGAMLNCYVRARLTDKALSHMQKMKDMGIGSSSLLYNDLMCLYNSLGEHEKIPVILNEMKENGVTPTNFTYRICMNSYGAVSDINGVEKIIEEMECLPEISVDSNTYIVVANVYINEGLTDKALPALKKAEERLDKKDPVLYNHLISLYASLGNKAEVMRVWDLQKDACNRHINRDYITMLGSLLKLGEYEEAEKLLKEWESSDNYSDFRVPNVLIVGYCKKQLVEKAEAILEDLTEKGLTPTPNSWGIVAAGYVHKQEMENAIRCMKMAFSLREGNEGWKPNPKVIFSILRWLGDKGKVEEVEAFVELVKNVFTMDIDMYHALIKACIRGGKEVTGLLESMKADNIDEDEKTKEILSLKQDTDN